MNLADAIAEGVDPATMRAGIGERTAKKAEIVFRLQEASESRGDLAALEQHLPKTLALWRSVLREPVDVADAAAVLKKLIKGKLECSPAVNSEGKGYYVITGEGTLRGALPHNLASPTGFVTCYATELEGVWVSDRRAA